MERYVDDGNPASFVWCGDCIEGCMVAMWGKDLDISIEARPKLDEPLEFLDTVEMFSEGSFHLAHHDGHGTRVAMNMPMTVARYLPFPCTPYPVRYVRSLLLGKLARVRQVEGDEDDSPFIRAGWSLLVELNAEGKGFKWDMLAKALIGARSAAYRRISRRLRAGALALSPIASMSPTEA